MTGVESRVRFDSKAQKERFMRAAERRRWSLNSFLLVAGEEFLRKLEAVDMGVGLVPSAKVEAQEEAGAV